MRISLTLILLMGLLSGCSTIKHWMITKPQQHVVKKAHIVHQPDMIIANLADDSV